MNFLEPRSSTRLFVAPVVIFLIGIAGSLLLFEQFRRASEARDVERFERLAQDRISDIQERIQTHVSLLRGAAGVLTVQPGLSRDGFATYVERLRMAEYYPGVQGIGYAIAFDEDERNGVAARFQREYGRIIPLRPEGQRETYSAILFIEPQNARNATALGFDMYSEEVRRAAMINARDNASATMSGVVRLVQEIDADVQPGFLIYVPVFEGSGIPGTLEARRAQFRGWAYSPFRTRDFFAQMRWRDGDRTAVEVAIYDGTGEGPERLLYKSANFDAAESSFVERKTIANANRNWTLVFAAAPAFFAESNRSMAYYILAGSLAITLILSLAALIQARAARDAEKASRRMQELNNELAAKVEEVEQRTADLKDANDEIQRFAYIVSHDLRSPLVNIMGFTAEVESIKNDILEQLSALQNDDTAEAAKTLELTKDLDESLGFIKSSIGKMDRLINSILKLSREGQRSFKPEYVSMDQLIKTITDAVAHQAAEKEAEIVVEALPPLKSDRLALEQIFSNLVDNALKYTAPGRPAQVRIRGRVEHSQVVYEVQDNGRGIAPEDHQRVFDLFRRAGEQDQKGEGIGLAHTRALVRRLGGYMSLKSALGEGSTFIVTLPRRMQEEEKRAA